jgi:hypothetical protein
MAQWLSEHTSIFGYSRFPLIFSIFFIVHEYRKCTGKIIVTLILYPTYCSFCLQGAKQIFPKFPSSHSRLSRPAVVTNKRTGRSDYTGAIPDENRTLSLEHREDLLCRLSQFLLPLSNCALSIGIKSSKRDNPFNSEIERWNYTSTSPHIFKA